MRDYLLAETARRRTKEGAEKKSVRRMLSVVSKLMNTKGPTEGSIQARKELTEKLYELEHPETKGGENLRQQVASAQLSDMGTKRFFRNYKAAAKQQWINNIKKAEWEDGEEPVFKGHTTTPKQVPHELSKFWKMVYGEKKIDKAAMQDLLEGKMNEEGVREGGMRARAILRPSREALEAEVTDIEVEGVLERLPLGKSAGPDRIPNGVYKHNPKYFAPKLGALIRESIKCGRLPSSFYKGDISVLYKKGDRDDPRNYRPITLLQNAYKVFTRIQAQRLKKVVHEFVSECQKGFVPHAFIAECSMLINLIEAYMNDEEHPKRGGLMLFLDMEKAFDRVSYEFLMSAAEAVGFGPNFLKTLGMMYSTDRPPKRRIYANGFYSNWFDIKSGVAQGCPLSPLLFLLVAEALKIALYQEPEYKGITIGDRQIKTNQFADDSTLFLAGPSDMPHAERGLKKWCRASGMRENYKKREGLAMGRYSRGRRRRTLPAGTAWVKKGEWAKVLGSPVGNNLDHELWWSQKIKVVQGKAQRFIGLFRSSYFGRNLIVQSKYLGSLRYWLYSVSMNRATRLTVQTDADTLLWSKTPDLGAPRQRYRRWVAERTAIGPRGKGGLKTIDWDSHVTAVLQEWILRWIMPPDRDECAWKHVLHHMVLVDKQGYDKFPEGRNIFLCRMTPADKLRLMRGVPKRAVYIKECIRAFWKLNLQQDLSDERHMRAESFWHNNRFRLDATPRERKSFSTVLDVQIIGDVFDMSTNEPRTVENWAEWARKLYTEHEEKEQQDEDIDATARRMAELVSQLPDEVVRAVQQQAGDRPTPKSGAIVALVRPGVQNHSEEIYARVSARGATRVRLDAYGIPHDTGTLNRDTGLEMREVEMWGTKSGARVRGPSEAVFPKLEGWKLDGQKVKLHTLKVSRVTAALTLRKFVPPASEDAWNQRRGKELRWKEGWKLTSFFATPRDQVTWLKFQHRTLYTVGHDTKAADGDCRACNSRESQLHLVTCGVLRTEFWDRIIELLVEIGMSRPEDDTDFLITGQLSDVKTVGREYVGVIFIAFRCLYAAITESRLDAVPLDLAAAYDRTVSMVVSRLNAVGEKWKEWVRRGERKRTPHIIPKKHCEKCVMSSEPDGEYGLHPAILAVKQEIDAKKAAATATRTCPRVPVRRPRPAARTTTAPADEPATDARTEEEAVTVPTQDEWRDMSGDAITYAEAVSRGVHAQCTLASVRNLRRNPAYSVRRLSERCYGARYMDDIRCPDWPMLMEPMLREGEVVKRVAVSGVRAEEMSDFRAGVVLLPGHVVCFHNDEDGAFRVYDNDSVERQQGRPRRMRADEIIDTMSADASNTIIGVLQEASDLSRRLGPVLTSLFHTRR